MPLWDQILDLQAKMTELRKAYFFQEVLYSYQWWILVVQTIIFWVVWGILVDQKRLKNILLVGLLSAGIAIMLDDTGLTLDLWNYPYRLFHFSTRLSAVDMVAIPVAFMLIYQYCRNWRTYLIITILFALYAAFILEPLYIKLNIYTIIHWKHIYSAPIYAAIGVVAKGAADIVERIQHKAREKEGS
ncbi:MAG TPA: CBO0543 family protein [Bacillales bacterium]